MLCNVESTFPKIQSAHFDQIVESVCWLKISYNHKWIAPCTLRTNSTDSLERISLDKAIVSQGNKKMFLWWSKNDYAIFYCPPLRMGHWLHVFWVPQLKEYETQNKQSNSVDTTDWTDTPSPSMTNTPSPSMTESSYCNVSFPVTVCCLLIDHFSPPMSPEAATICEVEGGNIH